MSPAKGRVKKSAYARPYNPVAIGENTLWQLSANKTDIVCWLSPIVVVDGFGPNIGLSIKQNNAQHARISIDLTSFTHEELSLVKELLDNAFKLALEVSLGRDKRAEELSNERDFPIERLTRAVPRLFANKRAESLDGESLLQRPVNVSDDPEPDDDKSE